MSEDKKSRAKIYSYATLSGFFGEYLEDGITRFLHDFTNTKYIEADLSSGIISAIIANITLEAMKKDSLILSTFLSTILISIITIYYDYFINKIKINYGNLINDTIFDCIALSIIMFYYDKLLKFVKQFKKRSYEDGAIYYIIKDNIETLPITIYYGYKAFLDNLKENKKVEEDKEKQKENKNNKIS